MNFAEILITYRRVDTIEQQVGAGLIEEIILMAEGENKLVDEMKKNEVYVPQIHEILLLSIHTLTVFTAGPTLSRLPQRASGHTTRSAPTLTFLLLKLTGKQFRIVLVHTLYHPRIH